MNSLRVLGVIIFVLIPFLNLTGFCWTKFHYVSAAEMGHDVINASVKYQNGIGGLPAWVKTPEDLRKYYPNCCQVSRAGDGILFDLFGATRYHYTIRYPLTYAGKRRYDELVYVMDCCGRPLDSPWRMSN